MKIRKIGVIAILASAVFTSCKTEKVVLDEHHFTNKLYINATENSEEILFKAGAADVTRTLSVGTAMPLEAELSGVFVADASYLDQFRKEFAMPDAQILPASCCSIENPEVIVRKGSNKSSEATVTFQNLSVLDRDIIYVMPIVLKNVTDINVISSKTAYYYVFRGAALINVVCNMSENRAAAKTWATPEKFNNMTHFTAEALVRQNKAGRLISTVMGTEGGYLLRIGDAGVPDTQLQIASSSNQTNSNMALTLGEWVHIACVYNAGKSTVYFNGKKVLDNANSNSGTVTWGAYGDDKNETTGKRYFWLGYSYAHDRYFDGEMSEVRIWDHCLTEEEINAENHFYFVEPSAAGLIAYWKMDEGEGTVLHDSSPNGNHLELDKNTTWPKVALPAKQ